MSTPVAVSRKHALLDLLLVVGLLVAVKQAVLPYSMLFGGPASTFSAMVLATWLLHHRGSSWADLGLRWPDSWPKTLGLTIIVFVLLIGSAAGFGAIADLLFEDVGTSGRFDFVEGNTAGYILMLALVWTHGSFFEELLFRAFVITKVSDALGGTRAADYVAVVASAIFFGYRHYYYQGLHGAVVTGGIGLVLGVVYVTFGRRNILPLALTHGAVNTLVQTQRYLGMV